MEIIDKIIFPPRHDHILVSDAIIIAITVIYFIYLSFLTGATLFSAGFIYRGRTEENPFYTRFGKDLIRMAYSVKGAILLGLLPPLALALAYAQIFYGSGLEVARFFQPMLIFTLIGAGLSLFYCKLLEKTHYLIFQILVAVAAVFFLFLAAYGLISVNILSFFPEKWMVIKGSFPHIFDATQFVRLLHFMVFTLTVTGVSVLFFTFNLSGGNVDADEQYRDYALKFGAGLALAGTLLQPLFILWTYKAFPTIAESLQGYYVAAGLMAVLYVLSVVLYLVLANKNPRLGSLAYVLMVLATLVLVVDDTIARRTGVKEQYLYLQDEAAKFEEKLALEREELKSAGGEISVARGEQIYNARCTSCHQFDKRVVGPPHVEVLPKYVGKPDELVKFILNPVKVNPDYPPMPNLGLSQQDAEAVAKYLLDRYQKYQAQQGKQ